MRPQPPTPGPSLNYPNKHGIVPDQAHGISAAEQARSKLYNIDELERQYAAVLEARKLKDEFLANISHELRTPLTAVMGYVSLLQDESSGPLTSTQQSDLSAARRASERLLELIDDLLELTALKRGAPDLLIEDLDALSVLRYVMDTTDGKQPDVDAHILSPAAPLPPIRADRRKLTRLLGTIVGNAYKFTSMGSVTAGAPGAGGT